MPYQTQLQWLMKLSRLSAWKAYAWHRAKELEADPTGLWTGIKQDLIGLARDMEFARQRPGKPRSQSRKLE